jgi:hypothetical protein
MTMGRSRDTLPMSRLRVFREADFADDEAPTEPGGFALAAGTGTVPSGLAARMRAASGDGGEVRDEAFDATEPHEDQGRSDR